MLNKDNVRMLAYVEEVTDVLPIEKADRLEVVRINGWSCVVGKGEFHKGDLGVFFEIDSKLPEVRPFTDMEFLAGKHYKIKSQKIRGVVSQGLFMPMSAFEGLFDIPLKLHADCTELMGVTYAVSADNKRKNGKPGESAFKAVKAHHPVFFSNPIVKKLVQYEWFRKFIMATLGKKAKAIANKKLFPVGKFEGVSITDQERVENMPWVLTDKTPFIVTQKCDGSSATLILERKPFDKFEFYVCSRKVRMLSPEQENYFSNTMESNLWWDVAKKYDVENKMRDYLKKHPEEDFICWQGEACFTNQGNPHHLAEPHLYLFHMMTTSSHGKWDILEAKKVWDEYGMESVPIVAENYILPDDLEEFKVSADGTYDPACCEGQKGIMREGFVYYKTTDPNFSFKNVSRKYLLKHNG